MLPTLDSLAQLLESGRSSAEELLVETLERCRGPAAEHVFIRLAEESALKQAREMDRKRRAGNAPSPWAGIPISVKDLFDVEGMVTTAGSKALAQEPPAKTTAPSIQRLVDAGFVIVGRTNMTEFAYSGLGLNPHYGTPANPCASGQPRIPGGSSSGGAVSVAAGLVAATIGTDTGGSVRIPAALCNLVGFKPGSRGVSCDGVVPLAETLDSVGPLANSVACCAILYGLMSGRQNALDATAKSAVDGLKLLVPKNSSVWRDADASIVRRCEDTLARCESQGVSIITSDTSLFDEILDSGVQGAIAGFESARWHESLIAQRRELYDPRVSVRIDAGKQVAADAYRAALQLRDQFIARYEELLQPVDAVVWPSTACYAPTFAELEADDDYGRCNLEILRNTSVGNVVDASAITLPMPVADVVAGAGDAAAQSGGDNLAAGLMLLQTASKASTVLSAAAALETVVGKN